MKTRLGMGFIIGSALFVAACGGGSPASTICLCPTMPPPPRLIGCNANPTSVELGATEPFVRRRPAPGPRDPFVAGLIAVKFSAASAEPEIARALARIHAQQISARNGSGYITYSIPPNSSPAAAAAALAPTHGIAEAHAIPARYLQVVPNDLDLGPPPPYTGPYTTPPHPSKVQWDMWYTQMPAAWDITQGSATKRIAVIDSGYDANNNDICSKVVNSAVFDTGSGVENTGATAQDDDGHGSAVSGIAASVTNNVTRYAGVAWNAELLEVRVFKNPTPSMPNPAGASSQDVAAAITWSVAHGANVINMSLGGLPGQPCDPGEQAAISAALNANVVVVVASGNGGNNVLADPANCNGVLVVGASALDDLTNPSAPFEKVAGYSSYLSNKTWGLVAPAGESDAAQQTCNVSPLCDDLQWIVNNWSTTACCLNSNPPHAPNHGVYTDGTSMAAPHVAGVAALMLSKNPNLMPAQIAAILEATTDDVCAGCVNEGAGRLNAAKALAATP